MFFLNRSEFRQNLIGTIIRVLLQNLRAQSEIGNHERDQQVSVQSEPSVGGGATPPPQVDYHVHNLHLLFCPPYMLSIAESLIAQRIFTGRQFFCSVLEVITYILKVSFLLFGHVFYSHQRTAETRSAVTN